MHAYVSIHLCFHIDEYIDMYLLCTLSCYTQPHTHSTLDMCALCCLLINIIHLYRYLYGYLCLCMQCYYMYYSGYMKTFIHFVSLVTLDSIKLFTNLFVIWKLNCDSMFIMCLLPTAMCVSLARVFFFSLCCSRFARFDGILSVC